MAKGAAWMIMARFCDRGIGMLSTIVLARLLAPTDFGLVSMAVSIIAMLEVLGQFNFDVALIQKVDADRRHYDTAWTFNVGIGVISSLALLAVAHPASLFFREPRLRTIVMLLAFFPLMEGLQNIGMVEFRKRFQFGKEFAFLFSRRVITFLVVLPLAIVLKNYWALVIGVVSGRVAGLALSYIMQPYRPAFSLEARHELFHFSKWVYVNNLTQFLVQRAPDIVIGRIAGPRALGLFNVSHEIAYLPTNELVAPINRAIFPGYAQKSKDLATLRQGFLDVISMIGLIMVPAAAGMFLTADLLVEILLGPKWLDAQPIVRLMAIAGLLFTFQTNPTYVHFALGKPRNVTFLTFIYALSLLPIMIVATRVGGPLGAAWAYVATAAAVLPVSYWILLRELELGFRPLLARLWRPLVATAVMAVAVRSVLLQLQMPATQAPRVGFLLLIVLAGVVAYGLVLVGLWRLSAGPAGAERLVLEFARQKLTAWSTPRG